MKAGELAAKAGVNKNTVTRAFNGESQHAETVLALVKALGHTMKELHDALETPGITDRELAEIAERWPRIDSRERDFVIEVVRHADPKWRRGERASQAS